MKTNKIRLTKSQLRNMIAEAINELNWMTYANAAKEAEKWNDNNWSPDFRDMDKLQADTELRKKSLKYYKNLDRIPKFIQKADDEFQDSLGGNIRANGPSYFDCQKRKNGSFDNPEFGMDWEKEPSEKEWNKATKAQQEVADFYNDKYAYDGENGWHLKESQLKNIIRRAVREALQG